MCSPRSRPRSASSSTTPLEIEYINYDVLVIGSGPAGYVCAIRCAQLGLKTAVVEREQVGGVCLNVGCIPSKALINAGKQLDKIRKAGVMGIEVSGDVSVDIAKMVAWKEGIVGKLTGGVSGLLKSHKIALHMGTARLLGPDKVEVEGAKGTEVVTATNIVIAVGSSPIEIPGFSFDGEHVWSSTEALAPKSIPGRMLIIGGGYIGLELGLVYRNLGTEIRIVEFMDRVLPGMEAELSKEMGRSLKKKKVPVRLNAKATAYRETDDGLEVDVETGGKTEKFACDVILSTVGRRPNGGEVGGLRECGVEIDDDGFVVVDAQRRSSVPGIWAIGDCACQPMLAHKGSY